MKKLTRFLSFIAIAGFGIAALSITSCTKDSGYAGAGPAQAENDNARQKFQSLMHNMPDIGIYDERTDRILTFNPGSRNFSFSSPNPGWNYSNSSGPVFVPASEGGGVLIIPAFSFGANTGGTVVAGSTALDINYTFCFSASDEALGLDLFDFGGDFTGVSIVLGIAGDFEALADGDVEGEGGDFGDWFQGMAMYVVYANEASGSYSILNWLEDIDEDPDDLADKGFSWVVDFQNFNLYFSANGDLSVSGGEMNFSGEYLGLAELFEELDDDGDLEFNLVPGFGTMGCN